MTNFNLRRWQGITGTESPGCRAVPGPLAGAFYSAPRVCAGVASAAYRWRGTRLSSTSDVLAHFITAFVPAAVPEEEFPLSCLVGESLTGDREERDDTVRRVREADETLEWSEADAAAFFSLNALLAASTTASQVGAPPRTGDLPRLRPTGDEVLTDNREPESPVGLLKDELRLSKVRLSVTVR